MKIPTRVLKVAPLDPKDGWARCASCGGKPRRVKRRPQAVWIGWSLFEAPAMCVCAVCLCAGLERLGMLVDVGRLAAETRALIQKAPPS